MKDNELRGVILDRVYELRHDRAEVIIPGRDLSLPDVPDHALGNICSQLADYGLLDYKPHRSSKSGKIDAGIARITARGVDVIEGTINPPLPISLQLVQVQHSSNVQIGHGNIQNVSGVDQINIAIDQAEVSQSEKAQAKSLLAQLAENKLLIGILKKFGLNLDGA